MPGMDGWETAQRLRASSRRRVPIIIISADPRHESQRALSADDHDAYLMKPLRLSLLQEAFKTLMDVEWIEADADPIAPISEVMSRLAPEHVPSSRFLESLRHMGEIGHIHGILLKLEEIGTAEPGTVGTLSYLRRLAEDCDLESYNSMIEALERYEA
jgi:response regulator RpfG family c-di-GMP phosphodiesterase